MKLFRTLSMVMSICVVVFFSVSASNAAELPDAPTIIAPISRGMVDKQFPVITGLAPAGTRVAVYIDDTFNGYASTVSEANGVQSFSYLPFLALEHGMHTVMARAEELDREVHRNKSAVHKFTVELPLPTPTVIGKVVDERVTASQPWIVGLAPSTAVVELCIDGVFNGTATATEDESGVGSFAYQPYLPLTNGSYAVTAVAVQERIDGSIRKSATSESMNVRIAAVAAQAEEVEASTVVAAAAEIVAAAEPATTVEATATVQEQTDPQLEEPVVEENTDQAPDDSAEENLDQAVTSEEEPAEEVSNESEAEQATDVENSTEETVAQENEETEEAALEQEQAQEEEGDENEDIDEENQDTLAQDNESEEEEEVNAPSKMRKIIGWILLIVAVVIFFFRLRKRQKSDKESDKKSEKKEEKDGKQQQLDLHVPTENKNIEVVKKDEKTTEDKSSGFADPVEEADSDKNKDKS